MSEKQASSSAIFQYVSRDRPLYDFAWEHVEAGTATVDPIWRLVVDRDDLLATAQAGLALRVEIADQWEVYAQAVTQAMQRAVSQPTVALGAAGFTIPWGIAGQTGVRQVAEQALTNVPTDAVVGLYDYVTRTLRQPLIVETIVDGDLLARTTVRWPGEQDTVWGTKRLIPVWSEVHSGAVAVAGRIALAVLQREAVVAAAVRRAQEQGVDSRMAWVGVQQLAGSVPQPQLPLRLPPPNAPPPHIVTGLASLALDWCRVPGGSFMMGSEQADREKPIHQVLVDEFYLARYPVTNRQYQLFMDANGYNEQRWWTEAGWQARQKEKWTEPLKWQDTKWNGSQQPVVGVSWYEAMAFCTWAAEATGERIRLPTEAEWEKAARGVDGRTYPWGEADPNDRLCNFYGNVGQTTTVGRYSPLGDSLYGVTDMAGNVLEWCCSKYVAYPYQADDGRNDETGTGIRVLRGGSWYFNHNVVRCAYRLWVSPDERDFNVGFRCANTTF